jgi:hypothetical protein
MLPDSIGETSPGLLPLGKSSTFIVALPATFTQTVHG